MTEGQKRREERNNRIYELRTQGLSFRSIGVLMNITQYTARQAYVKVLRERFPVRDTYIGQG